MRPKHNVSWPVWAVCALTAAAALALWPLLPARIPMHWNIDGAVDGWGPRHSVLYIPLLQLALCALMALLPRIDPLRRSYTRFLGAYQGTRLALALFLCAMEGTVLLAAFYPVGPWAARAVCGCEGALLCVTGNLMPKFRHNYFCGIRTPWTLADPECWRRTHRLAGPLWFWGGLALAGACLFLPMRPLAAAAAAGGLLLALVPAAASYRIYKKLAQSRGGD